MEERFERVVRVNEGRIEMVEVRSGERRRMEGKEGREMWGE